jgi:hypothetical protein
VALVSSHFLGNWLLFGAETRSAPKIHQTKSNKSSRSNQYKYKIATNNMAEHYRNVSGYMDPNWPPPWPLPDGYAPIIIYGYTPNFGFAVFGIVIFAIACVIHSLQVARYRCWYFIPMAVGCLLEVIGYIFRSFSASMSRYLLDMTMLTNP